MVVLTEAQVRGLVTMAEAIRCCREAYVAIARGEVDVPLRHQIHTRDGVGLVMSGCVPAVDGYGVKFVSVMPANKERGLPVTLGVLLLFDPQTGQPLALMDATFLTAYRTGAGTGVATDLLARPAARVLAIIGTGGQADAQLEAVLCVRPIQRVLVYNRTLARAEAFCRRHQGKTNRDRQPVHFEVVDRPELAAGEADIIVTATTSMTPVLKGEWLKPGAHVNAIGSHEPEMQEIDEETVRRAAVRAVDSRPGAMVPGDLSIPLRKGLITEADLVEIGEIAAGLRAGRQSDDAITLFKSVGHAAQDLVVGRLIYEKARRSQIGVEVPL